MFRHEVGELCIVRTPACGTSACLTTGTAPSDDWSSATATLAAAAIARDRGHERDPRKIEDRHRDDLDSRLARCVCTRG